MINRNDVSTCQQGRKQLEYRIVDPIQDRTSPAHFLTALSAWKPLRVANQIVGIV